MFKKAYLFGLLVFCLQSSAQIIRTKLPDSISYWKKENKVGFKEREIFWLRLGQNIGNEEFGKGNEFQRPVLIIKKLTKNIFIGVPLITTLKENDYFHQFKYSN